MSAAAVGIPLEVVIVLLAVTIPAVITLMAWMVRELSALGKTQAVTAKELLTLSADVGELMRWRAAQGAAEHEELLERRRYDFDRSVALNVQADVGER